METARLKELKEKYKDKKLTRSERQKILEEINAEKYKADLRKPLSIKKYNKFACRMTFVISLASFYTAVSDHIFSGKEDNPADVILLVLLMGASFVFLFRWMMMLASYKLEPDDELAVLNRLKAGAGAFPVWLALVAAVVIISFWISGGETLPIYRRDLYFLFISAYMMYSFIHKFIFMRLDSSDDYEDEE